MAAKKTIAQMEAELMEGVEESKPAKVEAPKPEDPWKKKVTIRLPKTADGSANYLIASVNGKVYKVMKGVNVDVPAPIAEVIEHMFEAEEAAELFIASHAN